MVTIVGWANIVFIVIMASIYPIKQAYMSMYKKDKEKTKALAQIYAFSRKAHPILGALIILLGFYHGSQAFSLIVLHTGTVLLYSILLMAIVAMLGQKVKRFKKTGD